LLIVLNVKFHFVPIEVQRLVLRQECQFLVNVCILLTGFCITTTILFFFYLNASTLNSTDTVRSGGGEKTLRSSRLPPPKYMYYFEKTNLRKTARITFMQANSKYTYAVDILTCFDGRFIPRRQVDRIVNEIFVNQVVFLVFALQQKQQRLETNTNQY